MSPSTAFLTETEPFPTYKIHLIIGVLHPRHPESVLSPTLVMFVPGLQLRTRAAAFTNPMDVLVPDHNCIQCYGLAWESNLCQDHIHETIVTLLPVFFETLLPKVGISSEKELPHWCMHLPK